MAVAQIFDELDFVSVDELIGAEDNAFCQILRRDVSDWKTMKLRVKFQCDDQVRNFDDIKSVFAHGKFGAAEVFVVLQSVAINHDIAELVKLMQRADGQGNYV